MEDKQQEMSRTFLFHSLVAMFQTLALQQLGKLANPINGKLERDLHQAKITIDMIGMIKEKTSGNLTPDEQRLIDTILTELQMNYVDEKSRAGEETDEEETPEETQAVNEDTETGEEEAAPGEEGPEERQP